MRIAIPCIILVFSCGCTVVPNDAWTFDPTRALSRPVLPPEQAARMTDRLAQLQLQRNEIRARIAAEPNPTVRLRLYEQLHAVGMELSPLDRRLAGYAWAR